VDGVPVADENEHEQQKGDKQQPGSFRRVNCMAVLVRAVAGRLVLAMKIHDNLIVRHVARGTET